MSEDVKTPFEELGDLIERELARITNLDTFEDVKNKDGQIVAHKMPKSGSKLEKAILIVSSKYANINPITKKQAMILEELREIV